MDESGTPELPGTSTHFVLVGVAIPIGEWVQADGQISAILAKYDLADAELHTAWMLRRYIEQEKIADFLTLTRAQRRSAVERYRAGEIIRLRKLSAKSHRQAKKNFQHTEPYIHLSLDERKAAINEIADLFSGWKFAFLFSEVIDKLHLDPAKVGRTISQQAFEQLVTRFDTFLKKDCAEDCLGVLIHDNNDTVARKHTELMRNFHENGTLWSKIGRIAETPLFVDSKLTRMVQIADLCSYALRRYVENGEEDFSQKFLQELINIVAGRLALGIFQICNALVKFVWIVEMRMLRSAARDVLNRRLRQQAPKPPNYLAFLGLPPLAPFARAAAAFAGDVTLPAFRASSLM
jgi:hypothetical protein